MISKQTTLDLNGPILSFIQQPVSTSAVSSGTTTFIGIASAFFPTQDPPNPASNTGTLSYQWYAEGVGKLTNSSFRGATLSGTATTTLTISNLTSPTTNESRFYLEVDYVPSAYAQPVGSAVTIGTGRSTGNAVNEVLKSDTASLIVFPVLSIAQQPTNQTAAQTRTATFTTLGALTDTSQGSISYRWQLNNNDLSDSSTVTGSGTPNLSISLPNVSTNTVRAQLTHPNAGNSPIFTNSANFTVVSARSILNFEVLDGAANEYEYGSVNLFDQSKTFTANPTTVTRSLSIYAPEKDINVKITMAAAAGASRNGHRGGQGGISTFTLTILQNQGYLLKLGAQTLPSGGANGGAGGAFFYRKGVLLVALGGGGGAGTQGRGGDGGGVNVTGEDGFGRSAGRGGTFFSIGSLPVQGFFAGGATTGGINFSSTTSGRASGCTQGTYYAQQGIPPCNDIGVVQFRGDQGRIAGSSAFILRGYKEGFGYRNNGGNASGDNGGGGSGGQGGNAGTGSGSGGGGGSGYSNGEVSLIDTRLGGNGSTEGFVTIEYLS